MNINDIDDLFEEESEEITLKEEDRISKLCFSIFDSNNGTPIGTGFLVNKTGLFLSAGHNFKTPNVKAIFRGNIYDIELIEKEYEPREPVEFAIGRLIDFNIDVPEPSFAIGEVCEIGTKIDLCGCKKDLVNQSDVLDIITLPSGINIHKQRITKEISEIKKNDPLSIIVEDSKGIAVPFEHHDQLNTLHGFSGGPAYIGNKIYGIITSHCYIKADYWWPTLLKYQDSK